ncbi:tRNA (adenosine(37)-N6)-threonylcarbamoyltransferase complex dimerization subunit type 1 TsaB [Oceanobacillus picturae]|jgi:tRNA threonylcarbamoyladenosine biosynthesis protein TsaB|uniref:tRNA (adenosine(37)-N6)-threonylcarbamoyltransferase complex dimerization subunit type 1 TsaB n=1 Tax=Oceanobacillus picturae TaxID=171693 RepID=UPI000E6A0CFE|nr:tRNA (adenosine(37)-N6)-threonylcarbamoyltransferase complex dimerization subunit type 1 TsaB [Oceanobacillus picturae]RIU88347.1 tRNA (adenosine(37)-N6)-threonylcarbamoyltransferase complex dimerization subunit type 1 TsaB [Oceanobacillus picturae]
MNILAIDTSNQVLGIAIVKDNKPIGEMKTNLAKNHSVRLMPAIDQLMRDVSITPDELDQIVVAKGPGSYTGVRIGLATAKSMAWALDIPVIGVSSLEVLAYQGRFFNGYICPFFDARRGLVYSAVYEWKNGQPEVLYKEENLLMADLLESLAKEDKPVLFLSPDIDIYMEAINTQLGKQAVIPELAYQVADASHLVLAGTRKQAEPTHALTPNYLRLAEAEAKWLKQQKEQQNNE